MNRALDTLNAGDALAAWQAKAPQPADAGWKTYPCKLVTPMYGGGVRAGEVDRELPIRVASIRGQLRFWWRVACGPFQSSGEMFARESAIWGGIADAGPTASQVRVRVRHVGPLTLEPAHRYESNLKKPGELRSFPTLASWAEGYALFSAQGKLSRDRRSVEDPPKVLARPDTQFELALSMSPRLSDTQRQEVLTALRWWASFGGVGARTRRGLGAVKVDGLEPVGASEVAKCKGRLVLRLPASNATEAWKASVGLLKDFRQKLNLGRNPPGAGSNSPAGRSLWPEADSIRALCGNADPRHKARVVPVDGFPRAAFGLPIVFHFKDEWTEDPGDHVLEPADRSQTDKRDRMASPLILRPYWSNGKWLPAALLLPGWDRHLSQPLKFKDKAYMPASWPEDSVARHRLADRIRPMQGRGDDALSAFMQFFEGK